MHVSDADGHAFISPRPAQRLHYAGGSEGTVRLSQWGDVPGMADAGLEGSVEAGNTVCDLNGIAATMRPWRVMTDVRSR